MTESFNVIAQTSQRYATMVWDRLGRDNINTENSKVIFNPSSSFCSTILRMY